MPTPPCLSRGISFNSSEDGRETVHVVNVVETLVLDGAIPTRILMLVRDLMAFTSKINVATKADNGKRERVLIKTT